MEYVHEKSPKEYLLAMRVKKGSRAAGQDVSANGLDGINGLYIAAVERPASEHLFTDVGGSFILQVKGGGQDRGGLGGGGDEKSVWREFGLQLLPLHPLRRAGYIFMLMAWSVLMASILQRWSALLLSTCLQMWGEASSYR